MGVDADKKVLVEIENKLLELLKNVVHHTLDDKELATTIEDAKKKSVNVKERVGIRKKFQINKQAPF